jgi:hypothetical protein
MDFSMRGIAAPKKTVNDLPATLALTHIKRFLAKNETLRAGIQIANRRPNNATVQSGIGFLDALTG